MNYSMRLTTFRLGVAILTFAAGLTLSWLFGTRPRIETTPHADRVSYPEIVRSSGEVLVPGCARTDARIDPSLASEIIFTSAGGMRIDSSQIMLRRGASKRFGDASVVATYSSTNEEWRGRLAADYYNNLLKIIETQDYFCMRNEYTTLLTDAPFILMSVTIGDHRKVVEATSEAEPIQLTTISRAIESTRRRVRWSRVAHKSAP